MKKIFRRRCPNPAKRREKAQTPRKQHYKPAGLRGDPRGLAIRSGMIFAMKFSGEVLKEKQNALKAFLGGLIGRFEE